ncbi:MAG: MerR family transcriptional regulator [Desulfobacterales bacterium]|jgi:DNA-binding transcriptional MerR regulator
MAPKMQDSNSKLKDIPDKLYFRIGEASKIVKLPTYVLRFWETEFPRIRPKRTSSGQRLYTRKDLELILKIKNLLYEKKFTIQGARRHLSAKTSKKDMPVKQLLKELHSELKSIKDLLD